jgi:predicted HicB family RNase H-like nuclease
MFIVKNDATEHVSKTIHIPSDILKQMESVAQKNKISVNNLIIQACRYAMSEYEEKKV